MKSVAPDAPPSFRPEAKAVAQMAANGPAYVAHWVRLRTAYFSPLTAAVAVAAEVVTVAVVVGAVAAGTSYDGASAGAGDLMALPVTGAY